MHLRRFTTVAIKNLGPGKHCDGAGLYIVKTSKERGKWVFRYKFAQRSREMGLGGFPSVGLQEARESAEKCRKLVREGVDPKQRRDEDKAALSPVAHHLWPPSN